MNTKSDDYGSASGSGDAGSCTCAHITLGSETTENRNWNPSCSIHGITSDWYQSEVQVAKRELTSTRLRVMQTLASLRCQDKIDGEVAQRLLNALDGQLTGGSEDDTDK
ncbi:MAG: hypothetical protein ACYCU8_06570 [Ferrimicrobium acidiphilum]